MSGTGAGSMGAEQSQQQPKWRSLRLWSILVLGVTATLWILSNANIISSDWAAKIIPGILGSLGGVAYLIQVLKELFSASSGGQKSAEGKLVGKEPGQPSPGEPAAQLAGPVPTEFPPRSSPHETASNQPEQAKHAIKVSAESPLPEYYPYTLSYLGLRTCIGIIGIALPFVLIIGKIVLESPGVLPSISAYYYSVMRDVLVGGLCALGAFLLSYRLDRQSDFAGELASISAVGFALFPAAPQVGATAQQRLVGNVHVVFTFCFFLTLAYFALVLFRKTDWGTALTRRRVLRNRVYLLCGLAIGVCIVLLALVQLLPGTQWLQLHPVTVWFESIAFEAFGIAWFVKGGFMSLGV